MVPIFFSRVYDEAMGLLIESRDYVAASVGDHRDSMDLRLAVSCETLRLTSRLTQVMAWLLVQRAVHSGEMTVSEALGDQYRLAGQKVCLTVDSVLDVTLPAALESLLDRSYRLYQRIQRLDLSLSDPGRRIAC